MPDRNLGTVWAEVGLDVSKFVQGFQSLMQKMSLLDQETQKVVAKVGKQWSDLGKTMSIAVTTPLVGMATQWVRTAAQFEQSMANAASVSRATSEELAMLEQAARRAGETTVYSASQSADAIYYLASAGFSASQSVEALDGVLALAAATQSDLAYTSSSVVSTLSQFRLQAEDSARISNVYAAAISRSLASMEKLTDAMRYAGPVAGSLGWQIEETTAVLMGLFDAGLRGEQAGTTLRQAMMDLANPVGAAKDVLAELGLSVNDVNPQLNSMADIMDTLNDAGIDTAQTLRLFGSRAGSGMSALLQLGSDAIRTYTNEITGTSDATEMAERQVDTFSGSMKLMISAWEELSISMSENFAPAIRNVIDRMAELFKEIAGLDPSIQRLIVGVGGVAAAMGPLTFAIGKLMTFLPALLGPAGLIALGVSSFTALAFAITSARAESDRYYDTALNSAKTLREQSDELSNLVNEYRNLEGKPDRSEEEHNRLEQVMNKIVEIQPALASGYDDIGEAISRNIGYIEEYTEQLRRQSDLEIQIAAQKAQLEKTGLEKERERLERERGKLATELGPEALNALKIKEQSNEARRLYELAITALKGPSRISVEEAFTPVIEYLNSIGRLAVSDKDRFIDLRNSMDMALGELSYDAQYAEHVWSKTGKEITKIEESLKDVNERLEQGKIAIEAWDRVQQGLDPWPEKVKSRVPVDAKAVEAVMAEAKDPKTLAEIIAEEEAFWQARINLVKAGMQEYVDRYKSVENVQKMHLDWLNRMMGQIGEENAETLLLRGKLAASILSVNQELAKVEEERWTAFKKTVEEQDDAVRAQIRLVENLKRISEIDPTEEADRLQRVLETMRMSSQMMADLSIKIVEARTRAYKLAETADKEAAEKAKREAEKQEKEAQDRLQRAIEEQDERVRRHLLMIQRITDIEELGYNEQADLIEKINNDLLMSEELQGEITHRIKNLRIMAIREEEAEQKRIIQELADDRREAVREQELSVRRQIENVYRMTQLLGLSYREQADELEKILQMPIVDDMLRGDIAYQVASLRIRAEREEHEQRIRLQKEADQTVERLERERQQKIEQIRRETVQREFEDIRHQAYQRDWSPAELAERMRFAIEVFKGTIGITEDEIRQYTIEIERLQKQSVNNLIAESERYSVEEQQQVDARAKRAVEALEYRAREEEWSTAMLATRMQELLQDLVNADQVSANLRVEISNRALDLRLQGIKEARQEEERLAEELTRAQERARTESVRAQEQDIKYRAALLKMSYDEQAEEYRKLLLRMDLTEPEREEFSKVWVELTVKAQEEIEAKRREYEAKWQQFLLDSGQTTRQLLLQEEIKLIEDKLRVQEVGSAEYEQLGIDLTLKQRDLAQQQLEDQKSMLNLWVIEGKLSTQEQIGFVQGLMAGYQRLYGDLYELSSEYQALKREELRLQEQAQVEFAQQQAQGIITGEKSIEVLKEQKAQLEALWEAAMSDKVKAVYKAAISEVESDIQKELKKYRKESVEAINEYSKSLQEMEQAELRAALLTVDALILKIAGYEELEDVLKRLQDLQGQLSNQIIARERRWGRISIDPGMRSEVRQLTVLWNELADQMDRIFSDEMLVRLQGASSVLSTMSEDAGQYVDKFYRALLQMRDLPAQFEESMATLRELGARIGGDQFGRGLAGAIGAYAGATQKNLSPLGSLLGGVSGLLTGLGVPGPWSGITAALGAIGGLFDPGPAPRDAQQLQESVKEVNKALGDWGVAYRAAQVSIKKTYFLFWQTGWKVSGEEAARKGLEVGQAMIQSMQSTLSSVGSALGQVLNQKGTWQDFQDALGQQLRRILMEEILSAKKFEDQAKLLVGQMHEAVAGGYTERELENIKRKWKVLFDSIEKTWGQYSGILDELFPEEGADTVEHTIRGVQITRLAGRDREFFTELWRPIREALVQLPDVFETGSVEIYQTYQESQVGAMYAEKIIMEYVSNVKFTGVIQNVSIGDKDLVVDFADQVGALSQEALAVQRGYGG